MGHICALIGDLVSVQEMANPQVQPHLHFLPEDVGEKLGETGQARCWLHEVKSDLMTLIV